MSDEQTDQGGAAVSRGIRLVLLVIAITLVWYLLADRYTPYTTQARIQGYVVGVAPKVAGLVTHVHVSNNNVVAADQPLFEIDAADYEIALERARAELANARSQVAAGDASVIAAEAKLASAQSNETKARQDYERLERLYTKDPGAISVRRLEMSKASLDTAIAQVAAATADIQRAIDSKGGQDEESNTILRAAQAAVTKAELDLQNTIVRAAQTGVITDLRTDVGMFANTGNPVMTLVATEDLWISAEFTENNLGHIAPDTPVEIVFDALPGEVFEGVVASIGLGISAASPPPPGTLPSVQNSRDWLRQSQRFPVEVRVNPEDLQTIKAQLRIGGQASVIAYGEPPFPLGMIGAIYIRLMSWLSYAY
jgi:multidrug resistance efflux pump